jgi:transcriptional regulator with XRE-family HTH domain
VRVTKWGTAVIQLLETAKVSQASFARDLGLHRVVLNRYLKGEREPPNGVISRINLALGQRLFESRIEAYLKALHWAESTDGTDLPDAVIEDGIDMLRSAFASYLRVDGAPELFQQLQRLGAARFRKLLLALCTINRRRSLRHIRGIEDPGKAWFVELQETCVRHGVDLKPWLKTERELQEVRALDAFVYSVERAVQKLSNEPTERLKAEQEIIVAGITLAAITRHIEENKT